MLNWSILAKILLPFLYRPFRALLIMYWCPGPSCDKSLVVVVCLVSEGSALDDGIFTLVYSCICRILDMFILGTLVTHAHRWHFLMEGVYTVHFECIRLSSLTVWVISVEGYIVCVTYHCGCLRVCVFVYVAASVCLCMLHRSRGIHCVCVCVTAQATYSADQVSSMSWRCTRSVAKGGDAEMRR